MKRMYNLCKTEQSALRQRQIEDTLLSEMAVRRYEGISVSDLCQKSAIPRKAFYRYFSSKEGGTVRHAGPPADGVWHRSDPGQ